MAFKYTLEEFDSVKVNKDLNWISAKNIADSAGPRRGGCFSGDDNHVDLSVNKGSKGKNRERVSVLVFSFPLKRLKEASFNSKERVNIFFKKDYSEALLTPDTDGRWSLGKFTDSKKSKITITHHRGLPLFKGPHSVPITKVEKGRIYFKMDRGQIILESVI